MYFKDRRYYADKIKEYTLAFCGVVAFDLMVIFGLLM